MQSITIHAALWTEVLEALSYLKEQTVDMDIEYGIELTEGEEEARQKAIAALAAATLGGHSAATPPACHAPTGEDEEPEPDDRRQRIVDLAVEQHGMGENIDVDSDATVSEGDDNGCYVSAWVWVNFSGTEFDKEADDSSCPCQDCDTPVGEDETYYATPCGTFCDECMAKHVQTCGICHDEFAEDFEPAETTV